MKDPKRISIIDYSRLLTRKMAQVPAWRDMAGACSAILGQEVDAKRRILEKMRDSVKNRRGDILSNLEYNPETDKLAINERSGVTVNIPISYVINEAVVKNVIRNIATFQNQNTTDYLDLAFKYNNEDCRWLKPINITQERDALLKNSYIMGFDFFNTKLSDEDLQRMYEYIQLYWEESGSSDNFMKFIGFIKNIRFDMVALWTEDTEANPSDNPDNTYPYLEPWNDTMISVEDGGENWLTSHVELQYDLAQFQKFYVINFDDLEELFYYFAPIILVLERLKGGLEVDTPLIGVNAVAASFYNPGVINTKSKAHLGYDSIVDLSQSNFDYTAALVAAGAI